MKPLKELLNRNEILATSLSLETSILEIVQDSRVAKPGSLFIAVKGAQNDGNQFVNEVLKKGAIAIVDGSYQGADNSSLIRVYSTRGLVGKIASRFWEHPTEKLSLVGVTGTNGKTTTTRITAHIAKTAGFKVGYTTSDGVYIQNQMMMKGDCTGPVSSQFVLKDPTVDFAVLECARGGILKSGLAFQHCDVAIVTNISADHIGLGGIENMEQMAKVKAVVPETVYPHGYAILNAEDDLVYAMKKGLNCNIALFSMDENNPRIIKHCKKGGYAAVFENGYISIMKGAWKIRVVKVAEVPVTYGGKALHNVMNCLPAVLSAYLWRKVGIEDIKLALQTFIPSVSQTPGRLNIFDFKKFKFLVDFAHNPAGLQYLCDFVSKMDGEPKVGIISGTGDRRDDDIRELGRISGKYFDEIIIRQDKHLRGRTASSIVDLLVEGINETKTKDIPIVIIYNEKEAISYAYNTAKTGSLVTIMCDVVSEALDLIKHMKETEDAKV